MMNRPSYATFFFPCLDLSLEFEYTSLLFVCLVDLADLLMDACFFFEKCYSKIF